MYLQSLFVKEAWFELEERLALLLLMFGTTNDYFLRQLLQPFITNSFCKSISTEIIQSSSIESKEELRLKTRFDDKNSTLPWEAISSNCHSAISQSCALNYQGKASQGIGSSACSHPRSSGLHESLMLDIMCIQPSLMRLSAKFAMMLLRLIGAWVSAESPWFCYAYLFKLINELIDLLCTTASHSTDHTADFVLNHLQVEGWWDLERSES